MINRDFGRLTKEKIEELLGSNILREIRKMDEAKASMFRVREDATSMAAFAKSASMGGALDAAKAGLDHLDLKAVVQARETYDRYRKIEQEELNRLMDPLPTLRQAVLAQMSKSTLLGALGEDLTVQGGLKKWMAQETTLDIFKKVEEASAHSAFVGVESLLADADLSFGLDRVMKNFAATDKSWRVPTALIDALGSLRILQDKLGPLTFPVVDPASALTLGLALGQTGIMDQLNAMVVDASDHGNQVVPRKGRRLGVKLREASLNVLLNLLIGYLFYAWADYEASRWQKKTDAAIAEVQATQANQNQAFERMQQTIAAFAPLIEQALIEEAKRRAERFVVSERMATVRVQPEPGAAVGGQLFPGQEVRPLTEKGKWIEFEYYNLMLGEYRTGWALKKYFVRVPGNHTAATR